MKRVTYRKGSLFDVKDPKAILAHACNCKGVWGSGIAVDFKQKFPKAFIHYEADCKKYDKKLLGRATLIHPPPNEVHPLIVCLFTSYDYGNKKDPEEKILRNTEKSVQGLLQLLKDGVHVHTPKINSGRFAVPWEKTEAVIERVLKPRNVKWTVWELPVTT
jgi:ADP-ribose 1''-phosphate phosphatase